METGKVLEKIKSKAGKEKRTQVKTETVGVKTETQGVKTATQGVKKKTPETKETHITKPKTTPLNSIKHKDTLLILITLLSSIVVIALNKFNFSTGITVASSTILIEAIVMIASIVVNKRPLLGVIMGTLLGIGLYKYIGIAVTIPILASVFMLIYRFKEIRSEKIWNTDSKLTHIPMWIIFILICGMVSAVGKGIQLDIISKTDIEGNLENWDNLYIPFDAIGVATSILMVYRLVAMSLTDSSLNIFNNLYYILLLTWDIIVMTTSLNKAVDKKVILIELIYNAILVIISTIILFKRERKSVE